MSELSNGTKKHTSKSRETIPLMLRIYENVNAVTCNTYLYSHKQCSSFLQLLINLSKWYDNTVFANKFIFRIQYIIEETLCT
jgi:hypothetical protein